MSDFSKKITIRRTVGEFELIDLRLEEMRRGKLTAYLRTQTRKLATEYKRCPGCITPAWGNKSEKNFFIDNQQTYKALQDISFIMQKPISSIVDDFFITPLLAPAL